MTTSKVRSVRTSDFHTTVVGLPSWSNTRSPTCTAPIVDHPSGVPISVSSATIFPPPPPPPKRASRPVHARKANCFGLGGNGLYLSLSVPSRLRQGQPASIAIVLHHFSVHDVGLAQVAEGGHELAVELAGHLGVVTFHGDRTRVLHLTLDFTPLDVEPEHLRPPGRQGDEPVDGPQVAGQTL